MCGEPYGKLCRCIIIRKVVTQTGKNSPNKKRRRYKSEHRIVISRFLERDFREFKNIFTHCALSLKIHYSVFINYLKKISYSFGHFFQLFLNCLAE